MAPSPSTVRLGGCQSRSLHPSRCRGFVLQVLVWAVVVFSLCNASESQSQSQSRSVASQGFFAEPLAGNRQEDTTTTTISEEEMSLEAAPSPLVDFVTPGAYAWEVPANATFGYVTVKLYGAGGAGGGVSLEGGSAFAGVFFLLVVARVLLGVFY